MGESLTVLVVEDNATTRMLLQQQIKALGHESAAAANLNDAHEHLRDGTIDLILLDCHIDEAPPSDFLDLGRYNVEKVAMTATIDDEAQEICAGLGIETVLKKPVSNAALRAMLDRDGTHSSDRQGGDDFTFNASGEGMLRELVQITDAAAVREVVSSFLDNSRERLAVVRQATHARDPERVKVITHAWKGVAGSFGAERLCRLLGRMEEAAGAGDEATCLRLLPEIEAEFASVDARLARLADELGLT